MSTIVDYRSLPIDATEMIIDRAVPRFDATIDVHRVVDAPRTATWRALQQLDLLSVHSPLLDAAVWARGLSDRLRARPLPDPASRVLRASELALPGWVRLGEQPQRELALGAVGRFWTSSIEWYDIGDADFAAFAEPGWGKIAANFTLRQYGPARTLLSYEARTATTDAASRRQFLRYWWLVRPVVGHIMRATLAAVAAGAEAPDRATGPPTSAV